jgi:hypothetical protein
MTPVRNAFDERSSSCVRFSTWGNSENPPPKITGCTVRRHSSTRFAAASVRVSVGLPEIMTSPPGLRFSAARASTM